MKNKKRNTGAILWFLLASILAIVLSVSYGEAAQVTQTVTFNLMLTDNSDNEDGFRLYRCQGAGCVNFVVVKTNGPNVTQFQDPISGDTGNLLYRYQATAFNAVGESGPTNIVEITSPGLIVIPGAPTGLIGSLVGITIP